MALMALVALVAIGQSENWPSENGSSENRPSENGPSENGPSENGPNILPIPPNKIKSPPPMPSLVEIFLYKKFVINKKL